MSDIPLEVPLRPFALTWGGQRGDTAVARIEPLSDPLDCSPLSSPVAALKENDNFLAPPNKTVLQIY